ncbi:MAG: DUF1385 domain-containing protein [Clostridia bacterium]|nr:DUF1385 domain-containing protein [Clostridia bacterium]
MMRGPKQSAMAVRNPQGEIVIEKWETKGSERAKFFRLPFIRGVFNFIDSMASGYKCLMRSAEISGLEELEAEIEREKQEKKAQKAAARAAKKGKTPEPAAPQEEIVQPKEEETSEPVDVTVEPEAATEQPKDEKKEKSGSMDWIMVLAMIMGIGLAVLLFIWLPAQIYMWLPDKVFNPENRYLRSAFEGIIRIVLLVGYMSLVSLMKDIRRTFMFHGAEHKTIFCYEAGLELTVENVRKMRRFHPRCGTSFLILMLLVSIVVGFFIPPTLPTLLRSAIKLALIPVIMGIGYELIRFAGRHDNILTRIISTPGLWLQRMTVFEPDDGMIECAIAAVKEVIPEDGSDRW